MMNATTKTQQMSITIQRFNLLY